MYGPQLVPLPRAEWMLDRMLADAESQLSAQPAGSSNRLAHLRMTRAAVDRIQAGEDQRAFDLLERAISLDGSTGFAYLYLGYVHLRHGDAEQASVFLDRAAVLLPRDVRLEDEVDRLRDEAFSQRVAPEPTP